MELSCLQLLIMTKNMNVVYWHMNVFLAYYTVEDRLHHSRTDAQTVVDIKLNVVLTKLESREVVR